MLTLRSLALLAAATMVASQTIETLDACAQKCYNDVKAQAGQWNCPADDMTCLCAVGEFKNGVHDCALGCPPGTLAPADYAGTVLGAVNALCATAVPGAPAPEPTTPSAAAPPPASSTAPPPAAEPVTSTPVPSSTTETLAAASTTTSTPASSTFETIITSSATPSSGVGAAQPTTVATTTPTSDTEEAGPTAATEESKESNEPAGLAVGAKAGIGIGAGAAVLALLGVGAWALTRQRRNKRANGFSSKHMIKISDPAPGGGRSFAGDHHYETGLSELEMKSRRYEDMIPRQQPKHIV